MISSGASTLVRRAVAAHNNADFEGRNYELPVWGAVLLGVTTLLFFTLDFMVRYSTCS